MTRTPDFRELIGDDLPPEECARLERVHDLLVAAGPPPELPPALAEPEQPRADPVFLPRRRAGAVLALAAALAALAFFGGYLAGYHKGESGFTKTRELTMHGTSKAPAARATLLVGHRDSSNNWPLRVSVSGLKPLPKRGYYEMFLSRNGKPFAPCGSFNVHRGTTEVYLNAPYTLKRTDGWVVTVHLPGQPHSDPGPVLLRT
jgi:hypothetical protein